MLPFINLKTYNHENFKDFAGDTPAPFAQPVLQEPETRLLGSTDERVLPRTEKILERTGKCRDVRDHESHTPSYGG